MSHKNIHPSELQSSDIAKQNPLFYTNAFIGTRLISDGPRYSVYDPANGLEIASVSRCNAEHVDEAVRSATQAQSTWAQQLPKVRARLLRTWFELIETHRQSLAELITLESGKPLTEAQGEVSYGAAFVEWFAEEARRTYGSLIPSFAQGRRLLTSKQAIGVVAAITPWNFPLAMITRKVAPALAAGCAVVLKPAEGTPLSALALAHLARQAGIPAELFSVITTDRSGAEEVGAAFCDHELVRKVTFTGSTAVGKWLMARSANRLHRLSLELGGNAPLIVFEDADLNKAVKGIMLSKFRNTGQTCICTNRVLVQSQQYDALVRCLKIEVEKLKLGHGLTPGIHQGPLISETSTQRLQKLVNEAVARGAELVMGGQARPDLGVQFFEPTILSKPHLNDPIWTEELFGPIITINTFETEAEAIALANDTRAGLAAYLFTEDQGKAWRVAEALEYGMVAVNDGALSTEVAPFGGVKESGLGREGGAEGIEEFLEVKYMMFGGLSADESLKS